ncbi:MAG: NAD-dependent epimerase/dehydratase family protein [Chitinophagales bacterium]
MNLVTGASGLVGSYVCRNLLLQGEPVRALKRKNSDLKLLADIQNKIEWVEGDINDVSSLQDAMQGVAYVYHAAAKVTFAPGRRNELIKVNVEGTANVVNLALNEGVKKMVHVSSVAALGRNPGNPTITEEIEWENTTQASDYAMSKHLSEREVWRGIAEGLQAVIVNPTIIVGAGNWNQGSCKIFKTIGNGFKFYTEGVRGYVDVRDVAKIAWQLMNSDIHQERFILNSENIVFRDFFFMIADALQRKRPSIRAKKILSELTWRAEALRNFITGNEPSVTKQTARMANTILYADNTKIKTALKYNFIPIQKSVSDAAVQFMNYEKTGKYGHVDF